MARPLDPEFFAAPAVAVARALVGATLAYGPCAGRIVETEAYAGDAASHFVTRPRTGRMLGETWGRVYLYRIYGVHSCLNFTSDRAGPGGVLIRALEPLRGLDAMRRRREKERDTDLASGPAKLFVALDVDWSAHGEPVTEHFSLELPAEGPEITVGPRVGIGAAKDLPWRFRMRGSRYTSRAK